MNANKLCLISLFIWFMVKFSTDAFCGNKEIMETVHKINEKLSKDPPEKVFVKITYIEDNGKEETFGKVEVVQKIQVFGTTDGLIQMVGKYGVYVRKTLSLDIVGDSVASPPPRDSIRIRQATPAICPIPNLSVAPKAIELSSHVHDIFSRNQFSSSSRTEVKEAVLSPKTSEILIQDLITNINSENYRDEAQMPSAEIIKKWDTENLSLLEDAHSYTVKNFRGRHTEKGTLLYQALNKSKFEIVKALLIKGVGVDRATYDYMLRARWDVKDLFLDNLKNRKQYDQFVAEDAQQDKEREEARQKRLVKTIIRRIEYRSYPDPNPKNPDGRTYVTNSMIGDRDSVGNNDGYPHLIEEEVMIDPQARPTFNPAFDR